MIESLISMHALALLIAGGTFVTSAALATDQSISIHDFEARSYLQVLPSNGLEVQFLNSIANLPSAVQGRLSGVADKGKPFSDGCNGSDFRRRFVAATKTGGIYHIALEQGGFVTSWIVMQYRVDATGKITGEQRIEPFGSGSQGQPVRSGKNQTSSGAGSGR